MIADRCPTCDRDACPWWATCKGITCPVACGRFGCAHVSTIAQNNGDDCARHAVGWRTRCLASEDAAAAFRGAARAEIDRLNVELHEATRRIEALEASDATEADALRVAVEDHLPVYALPEDDDDAANHAERIEYAGDEIKSLTRRLAVVEEAVRAVVSMRLIAASITADEMARAQCGVCNSFAPRFKKWIDDFNADLRAALENQP